LGGIGNFKVASVARERNVKAEAPSQLQSTCEIGCATWGPEVRPKADAGVQDDQRGRLAFGYRKKLLL
jgi:hypothetical protein